MATANGETPMKILISVISLALAVAFTAPAFAAGNQPLTKTDCKKAGMKWDESALVCAGRAKK
jgi:hypothetical protein